MALFEVSEFKPSCKARREARKEQRQAQSTTEEGAAKAATSTSATAPDVEMEAIVLRSRTWVHWNRTIFAIVIANCHRRPDIAAISNTLLNRETLWFQGANSFCKFRSKIVLFLGSFPCDLTPAKENRCDCDLRFWCAQSRTLTCSCPSLFLSFCCPLSTLAHPRKVLCRVEKRGSFSLSTKLKETPSRNRHKNRSELVTLLQKESGKRSSVKRTPGLLQSPKMNRQGIQRKVLKKLPPSPKFWNPNKVPPEVLKKMPKMFLYLLFPGVSFPYFGGILGSPCSRPWRS